MRAPVLLQSEMEAEANNHIKKATKVVDETKLYGCCLICYNANHGLSLHALGHDLRAHYVHQHGPDLTPLTVLDEPLRLTPLQVLEWKEDNKKYLSTFSVPVSQGKASRPKAGSKPSCQWTPQRQSARLAEQLHLQDDEGEGEGEGEGEVGLDSSSGGGKRALEYLGTEPEPEPAHKKNRSGDGIGGEAGWPSNG